MTDRGMGFRHAEDPRDSAFPMRLMLDPHREQFFPKGLAPGTRHYRTGATLNQGSTGCCTAFSGTHRVHAAPIMQPLPFSEKTTLMMTPFELYRLIVSLDEFSDNDAEAIETNDQNLQMGSSARASAKALQQLGLIKSYLHANSVEDIRAWHLAGFGGMLFGTTWYSGMMDTDDEGFVNVTGGEEGGHAYASHGWNDHVKHKGRIVRACRFQNSWGSDWGQHGFFWMEEDDIAKLWTGGEFVAPTEVKLAALKKVA